MIFCSRLSRSSFALACLFTTLSLTPSRALEAGTAETHAHTCTHAHTNSLPHSCCWHQAILSGPVHVYGGLLSALISANTSPICTRLQGNLFICVCVCVCTQPFTETHWPCGDNKAHYNVDPNSVFICVSIFSPTCVHTDKCMETFSHTWKWMEMCGDTNTTRCAASLKHVHILTVW